MHSRHSFAVLCALWAFSTGVACGAVAVPDDIAKHLSALASSDATEQRAAVEALAATGDRNVIPALEALREGSLYAWPQEDGSRTIVIAREKTLVDGHDAYALQQAYGGTPLTQPSGSAVIIATDALQEISTDRRLRAVIQPALERFKLIDPDPKVRKAAAKTMADRPDAIALTALAQALAVEHDASVRTSIEESYNLLKLADPSKTEQIRAAVRLGEIRSADAAPKLEELAKKADPDLKAAVDAALASIRSWQRITRIVYAVFSGFSLGSILMLMSLGLAITFGVMGVINMAHGELMMIGAYATFVTQNWFQAHLPGAFDYYFLVAIPLSFVAAGIAGFALERSIIQFLYGRTLETLLATWGVSLVLIQAARSWFGDLTAVAAPSWLSGGIEVATGMQLPYNRIFIIVFTTLCIGGVYLLLLRSSAGLRIRAVTQNRAMSAAIGIPTRRVDAWTFAFGSGLAGMAGCALTLIGNVDPGLGQNYIVDSFIVVVTGGVGKLAGTIVAALGIGWMNTIFELATDSAVMGKVLILVIVVLFLQRRPSGLFPPTGRSVEY